MCYGRLFEEVIITGGEPLLFPNRLKHFVSRIPNVSLTTLYTANPIVSMDAKLKALDYFNRITITIHEEEDIQQLRDLLLAGENRNRTQQFLRVHIFDNIKLPEDVLAKLTNYTTTVVNKTWIENCPLPQDEMLFVLKRPWKKHMEDKCQQ